MSMYATSLGSKIVKLLFKYVHMNGSGLNPVLNELAILSLPDSLAVSKLEL
jgi:hypothetical protein